MKIAEYVAETLVKNKVTDVFGIPGAVILDFIYAIDRTSGINAHLLYHEQGAGFAACGYAQASGKLGVAYATKGPGITNMITCMAEAYYDSIPVLFITAHNSCPSSKNIRFEVNQEIDMLNIIKNVTKYAEKVECEEDVMIKFSNAIKCALTGRKGPVFLDFKAELWNKEIVGSFSKEEFYYYNNVKVKEVINTINEVLESASRPVLLIGQGIRSGEAIQDLKNFSSKNKIPIISSRMAIDCMSDYNLYFGYIGSRGIRYSNFILSKSDVIIAIGNRMAYSDKSESYRNVMDKKKVIRIDIDENEFEREILNSITYTLDSKVLCEELKDNKVDYKDSENWISVCNLLKQKLYFEDMNNPVKKISQILNYISKDEKAVIVGDVGNNALWLTRSYIFSAISNRLLLSIGFSSLGVGVCKSIGAFYGVRNGVICFIGDQGLQMNIQELEFLAMNKIPILIVLLNNSVSGMIRNWENKCQDYDLHTTRESGYGIPDICILAKAYGIKYIEYSDDESIEKSFENYKRGIPVILNVNIDSEEEVIPMLKKGDVCQCLSPKLNEDLYKELDLL